MAYDVELRLSARGRIAAMEAISSPQRLPNGFCFLVSRCSGRPVQPAFDFLTTTYLSGVTRRELTVATNTIRAVVDDLVDFHNFLDASGLAVEEVNEIALENYLRSMTDCKSPVTGKPFQASTVRRRRSTVTRLLRFCQERGRLRHAFPVDTVTTRNGVVERFAPNLPGPKASPADKYIRAIPSNVLKRLLDEMGDPLVRAQGSSLAINETPSRLRLMAEVCFQTGLRRQEVCNLLVNSIVQQPVHTLDSLSCIPVEIVGKGAKQRLVPFPVWLINSLVMYEQNVRRPILRRANRRGETVVHPYLFVMEVGRKGVLGYPIRPKTLNREFAVTRDRMLHDLKVTKQHDLLRSAQSLPITVHALRHTFALATFIWRRSQGDACPAKYVQSVLGHSYQSTTENIYLRSSHAYESKYLESIDSLVERSLDIKL